MQHGDTATSADSPPDMLTVQAGCTQSADLSTLLKRLIFKAVCTKVQNDDSFKKYAYRGSFDIRMVSGVTRQHYSPSQMSHASDGHTTAHATMCAKHLTILSVHRHHVPLRKAHFGSNLKYLL